MISWSELITRLAHTSDKSSLSVEREREALALITHLRQELPHIDMSLETAGETQAFVHQALAERRALFAGFEMSTPMADVDTLPHDVVPATVESRGAHYELLGVSLRTYATLLRLDDELAAVMAKADGAE